MSNDWGAVVGGLVGGTVHDEPRPRGWALYNNNIIRSGPQYFSWGCECTCYSMGYGRENPKSGAMKYSRILTDIEVSPFPCSPQRRARVKEPIFLCLWESSDFSGRPCLRRL